MAKKIYKYLVSGDGVFPLDMLRHDRSWPSNQHSVQQMDSHIVCSRNLKLETLERGPDIEHWKSMGWKVSEQRRY